MFDLRLGGWDIAADFVGYLLLMEGIKRLPFSNRFFKQAATTVLFGVVISLFDVYKSPQPMNSSANLTIDLDLVGLISNVISLFAMYYLFNGIKQVAIEHQDEILSSEADYIWGINWKLPLFGALGLLLLQVIAIIPLVIAIIYVFSKTLGFINETERSFASYLGNSPNDNNPYASP